MGSRVMSTPAAAHSAATLGKWESSCGGGEGQGGRARRVAQGREGGQGGGALRGDVGLVGQHLMYTHQTHAPRTHAYSHASAPTRTSERGLCEMSSRTCEAPPARISAWMARATMSRGASSMRSSYCTAGAAGTVCTAQPQRTRSVQGSATAGAAATARYSQAGNGSCPLPRGATVPRTASACVLMGKRSLILLKKL